MTDPFGSLFAPFVEFGFMRRALAGCLALSVSAPPIGVFLTLRRMSLMSDAMSHAILPGAAVGFLVAGLSLPAMTLGGLVAGLAVALLAGAVTRATTIREDANLAAFYLISLAAGVLLVSLRGSQIDLMHFLFGSVLALDDSALWLLGGISTLTLLALAVIYRPLVMECVDPLFLRSVSRSGGPVHLAFLALVVVNLVGGFQALGTLLAVGLMLLPAVAARFWARDLAGLIPVSMLIAALASVSGLSLSYQYDLPSGPAIVLAAGALYVASMMVGPRGGLLRRLVRPRHLEA
ncbi:manganese transport system membrane protein MntC [Methylobacterium phyllosphaerae]|uniref:Manganese transport system membrane protein MntC n=4 Tax=Methylobacteriaceae TaxID=119045 RepID=A0AAE8L6Z6_9HYPH|nr:ABC-3 protein [Methylobacterium oryzae CBMB20]APT31834.1 manganese transport system membrane protein MntC [Methylobacterium phyllosphaerae]MBA9062182.1 zinc/manganese transport system permease protein [Methylobacterium fujisawaense]SFH03070.1 zinc/manganese transport system permease protein [Methylobacterium phyllosphaerae]SFU49264.1 zinc/manganese transport system permease protein [Methylobacterium sp. UNCCL125]